MQVVTFLATVVGLCLALIPGFAHAGIINFDFDSTLQTGTLAGTMFSGTATYNNQGSTGTGQEFLALTSLDFTVDGGIFTLADVQQGGQAILENGSLSYFTAAFFPPPSNTSLNDLAFGFGGPGVIGYSTGPGFNFGSGSYTITPELPAFANAMLGLLALAASSLVRPT